MIRWGVSRWIGFVIWALVTWLASLGAHAQTVTVRSGEHPGFSRLVVDIGADRDWSIQTLEDGSTRIRFEPEVQAFSLGEVFNLIPRTRLQGIEEDDGLLLQLACPCPVSADRYQERYLIVDIADPTPGAEEDDFEQAVALPETDAAAARRLAAAEALPDLTQLLLEESAQQAPQMEGSDAQPQDEAAAPSVDLDTAARVMAEQLARAAASGLLDAAPGRPLSTGDPNSEPTGHSEFTPDPPYEDPSVASPEVAEIDLSDFRVNADLPLRAETAIDAASNRTLSAAPQDNTLSCDTELTALSTWSHGAGVSQGLGALRRELYGIQNDLDPDAALALARHYLFYGFGAEAAFWLNQMPDPPHDLLVLAALFDDVPGPHFEPLGNRIVCHEEEFLFRYLDDALSEELTEDQAGRIQRALGGLPPVLRDQLGPRIARRLHDDELEAAARNVRDMILRGGRIPYQALLALDLDLGILGSDGEDSTREALARALRDDGGDSALIMAHALAFDREIGHVITDTRLVAAEALLRELGLGHHTAALWLEVTLAYAQRSQADRMLEMLAETAIPQSVRTNAVTEVFVDRLAAHDTATLFILARVHGASWDAEGSVAGRARVAAMAHLRSVGLHEAAEILRGAHRTLILPARPATEPAQVDPLEVAWQTGNWDDLSALASGAHQDVAIRMQAQSDAETADPSAEQSLSELASAVQDTTALRSEIASLLAEPTPRASGWDE